jgi:hypothetical protein
VESGEGEGGDVAVRQPVVPHPAKFSGRILDEFAHVLGRTFTQGEVDILDPFAGVGTLQTCLAPVPRMRVWCIELEREWAMQSPNLARTACADSIWLMGRMAESAGVKLGGWIARDGTVIPNETFPHQVDAIVTSPAYGNRMADSHTPSPSDTSKRHTYRHYLGRKLSANNAGGMQWGRAYRDFHRAAWTQAVRVLKDNGLFVLNVSDHIRKGRIQPVSIWHEAQLRASGLELVERIAVDTPRMGHGENGKLRVDCEWVLVFRKKA